MKRGILIFIIILLIPAWAGAYTERIAELQQEGQEIQIRIQDYKEVRLMTVLEFRAIIRSLQNNLQKIMGRIEEIQRMQDKERKEKRAREIEEEMVKQKALEKQQEEKAAEAEETGYGKQDEILQ